MRVRSEGMPLTRTRHYLHGDPIEGQPDHYFCYHCDAFEPREHFAACTLGTVVKRGILYIETHEWCYVMHRRKWFTPEIRKAKEASGFRLVDDLGNLFRTGTVKEQAIPRLQRAPGHLRP